MKCSLFDMQFYVDVSWLHRRFITVAVHFRCFQKTKKVHVFASVSVEISLHLGHVCRSSLIFLVFLLGVGVYISRVEEGSVAERAGLRPGDSILQVNGTPFTAISHDEALKVYWKNYIYRRCSLVSKLNIYYKKPS